MPTVVVSAQQEMVQDKMQAIILCAGMGTRISKSIDYKPKCMLRIGERTIIEHQIRIFKRYLNSNISWYRFFCRCIFCSF